MTRSGGQTIVVVVDEITKVGEARRRTTMLAEKLGFDELRQSRAALAVTEAATNLVRHAGGGEVLLRGLDFGPARSGLEILTLDSGPGMSDVGRCLADGYSSGGTAGTGLGAIRRVADSFDIYSAPGLGTVVCARLYTSGQVSEVPCPGIEVGVTSIAVPGEQSCGDNWSTVARDGHQFVLVVDGLGHGAPAAVAGDEAVRVFQGHRSLEPADIIESIHQALRATRGAALAIARLDPVRGTVRYAGVGNISGLILDARTGDSISMVSHNGTVGYTMRTVQSYDYPWTTNAILLMHSDGLATHWDVKHYAGLAQRHPSLVAAVLYRDHRRKRDDVTVLAARSEVGDRP